MLRYRKREIETVWAEQKPDGDWLIRLEREGPVSLVMSDARFQATYEVDDTGLGTHLNAITNGSR